RLQGDWSSDVCSSDLGVLAATIRERLGDQREGACDVLPQLAEILGGGAAAGLGPEAFGEVRSLRALAAVLDALGSEGRPALVLRSEERRVGEGGRAGR